MIYTQEQITEAIRKANPIAEMLNDELRKTGDLSAPVFGLVVAGQLSAVAIANHLDIDKFCDETFKMISQFAHDFVEDINQSLN